MDWFVAEGWAYFLIAVVLIHTVLIIGWFRQLRLRVDQLHHRLDTFWEKLQHWFNRVEDNRKHINEVAAKKGRRTKDGNGS